jgi:hypothetical protein
MKPDVLAEWLRRQGQKVLRTQSSYWVEVSSHIYQAFPYHWVISPSDAELHSLFFGHRAIGLRYSTPLEASEGSASYHVVFSEPEYLLSCLPQKARYDVKKGAKNAQIEQISFARLADEGWELRTATLERQGRQKAETRSKWQALCLSAADLPGFETWAAITDGKLSATLIAFTCDDCCNIVYQQSRTEYLKIGVNNALTFSFTNEILRRETVKWLFYGLHSLDAPPSVDQFKFRMGYRAKPVRQRVVFHPWVAPLFSSRTHRLVRYAGTKWPDNVMLAKAEGMIRFYLEGRRPLDQQKWPECLLQVKEEMVGKGERP